jgi:hypothetical protein
VAWQTAWLKVHFPRHFMAALMTSEMDRTDFVVKFINEASQMGIRILPPDINESNYAFTVVGPNIRFGLGAVKGVGGSAIESILEARHRKGRFVSLLDFCEAVDLRACNKKVIEALIKSGSFDFLGTPRKVLFETLENTADSAQRAREEKERGQSSLFGGMIAAPAPPPLPSAQAAALHKLAEWPDDEKLRFEKETLGFYITGHPLNKFADELSIFANATTDTLHQHIDEIVNIGGIVSQIKKSKIKKGPNEGKLMAKFILDDQRGSVEVVVFSDLYSKYAKWLDNGIAVLLTAAVKDTGGMQAGRSAALQSAEQHAQRADDEYAHVSGYDVSEDDVDDDRDPKEIEAEKYGDRANNLGLFGGMGSGELGVGAESPILDDEPLDDSAPTPDSRFATPDEDDLSPTPDTPHPTPDETSFASHAATFHEAPITPELNALEIVPLDGIRDKKVKEIALEVAYPRMTEETVRKIREIVDEHPGEVPLTISIVELPQSLIDNSPKGEVKLRVNQHFRVQPGASLTAKLLQVHATAKYVF